MQILPIIDKNLEHDGATANEGTVYNGMVEATSMAEIKTEERSGMLDYEVLKENGNFPMYSPFSSEAVQETSSDEGWQEANSKGRSGNTTNRKFGRRGPHLSKLSANSSENYVIRASSYRDITSPAQKGTPKVISTKLSPSRQSKPQNLTLKEDSANHPNPTKASVSKISPTPTAVSSLTSKSISYKEVAAAPPGTVLKPLFEKAEVDNVNAENGTCSSLPVTSTNEETCPSSIVETASHHDETKGARESDSQQENSASEPEEVSLASDQARHTETNVSKLSAAAKPFNPGTGSMPHHSNSVWVTDSYDANAPCGPRSTLYYRNNRTYYMKHGFKKYRATVRDRSGYGDQRVMNPHAPELVPRSALQIETSDVSSKVPSGKNSLPESGMAENGMLSEKMIKEDHESYPEKSISELEKLEIARQILFSLLVKSAQQNNDSADLKLVK